MKKIMFNDRYGLTAAVLQGRKTMTRRVCKEYATGQLILASDVESFRFYPDKNIVEFLMKDGTIKVSVPPYKENEVVAVAQAYNDFYNDECDPRQFLGGKGWVNKMFVRADLMPHKIEITGVRIERLQAISNDDCMKEGVVKFEYGFFVPGLYRIPSRGVAYSYKTPREAFATLINRPGVGRKGLWEENPFVFAYSFKLIK